MRKKGQLFPNIPQMTFCQVSELLYTVYCIHLYTVYSSDFIISIGCYLSRRMLASKQLRQHISAMSRRIYGFVNENSSCGIHCIPCACDLWYPSGFVFRAWVPSPFFSACRCIKTGRHDFCFPPGTGPVSICK